MITSHHKMAPLVAHLMHYYVDRELCPITFPDAAAPDETPRDLGFYRDYQPREGMTEQWEQAAQLTGERPIVVYLCRDTNGKWYLYPAFSVDRTVADGPQIDDWKDR